MVPNARSAALALALAWCTLGAEAQFLCTNPVGANAGFCGAMTDFAASTNIVAAQGWGASADPCSWSGLTCASGIPAHLELFGAGVTGTIPASFSLPALSTLTYMHFSQEGIGTLPDSFVNLVLSIAEVNGPNSINTGGSNPTVYTVDHFAAYYAGLLSIDACDSNCAEWSQVHDGQPITWPTGMTLPSNLTSLTSLTSMSIANFGSSLAVRPFLCPPGPSAAH